MAEARNRGTQRLVHRQLTRRAGQQVLPAQYVGDSHGDVVHRVDQGVQRLTVGADDDEVRHMFVAHVHLSAHEVVPVPIVIRHTQADHRLPALIAVPSHLFFGE